MTLGGRDLELPKPPPASGLLRKLLAVAYLRGCGWPGTDEGLAEAIRLELDRRLG